MLKVITQLFLLAIAFTSYAQLPDSTALKQLERFATNIKAFDHFYTQEKVYLHLDNNGYLPSETIWFKAYVFKASTLLPTDMSKVLYVELLSPRGQVMSRKTLPITNGRTYGEFYLEPDTYSSGYYEIRAYTRAMLNWDDAYIYSRIVPLFEQPKDTVEYKDLKVSETEYYSKRNSLVRSVPEPLIVPSTQKEGKTMLTFYPEGGNIIQGKRTAVAYKLTDSQGLPLDEAITVYDKNGTTVTTVRPLHDGMGQFYLPASWQSGYATVGNNDSQFNLPAPLSEGAGIHITEADSAVSIHVHTSYGFQGKPLGISIMCRAKLCHFQTFTAGQDTLITIPRTQLSGGINQITLFTPQGEVLSERLVWNAPHLPQPTMRISQNKDTYAPFSPIVLDIKLTAHDNTPLQSDFSLSVRDASTETGADSHGLQTEMLLASELRGYIHNPDYYFKDTSPQRARALDLLLMVQGWRRYSWKQMSGTDSFQLKQPTEDGLLLFGKVRNTKDIRTALNKYGSVSVNFMLNTEQGTRLHTVGTDPQGRYALQLPDFYGDAPSVITVTNKKDRRLYTDLTIERNFSPSPKPYEPLALATPVAVEPSRITAIAKQPDTFEWQDTIPDYMSQILKLGEVKVKGKKPTFGYEPSPNLQSGYGESVSRSFASYIYDIPLELDKYLDQGNAVPRIWDWLATVNPRFFYSPADGEMLYGGKPMPLFFDIDKAHDGRSSNIDPALLMNGFRTLIIIEGMDNANHVLHSVLGGYGDLSEGRFNAIGLLFSIDEQHETEYYRRGTRWAKIHGYSHCEDFYSPDYRKDVPPTQADHRRTLYWNPSLTTDKNGKANVIFYSNAHPDQRLHINAEGIATNGQMFEYK